MHLGNDLISIFFIDCAIQTFFYIISAIQRTEKYYDVSGALTYAVCLLTALLNRTQDELGNAKGNNNGPLHGRQILVTAISLIWCIRLGIFLMYRVNSIGHDWRFKEIKNSPLSLAGVFFAQVVWVFVTAAPVYITASNPSSTQKPFQWTDYLGLFMWIIGIGIEAVSDCQKFRFKDKHPNDFITTGLFKWSRHPNYFGETLLWWGTFLISATGFASLTQWMAVFSPIFVYLLLFYGSGVPFLEASHEKRYGHLARYRFYKARTSIFTPRPPNSNVHLGQFQDLPEKNNKVAAAAAAAKEIPKEE